MNDTPHSTDPRKLSDEDLLDAFHDIDDHEALTPDEQAIIDEMQRRELEF